MMLTAAGTALTIKRMGKKGSMDTAAWVSLAGGGALAAAGALLAFTPTPAPQPQGPLPQLMQRLGLKL